MDKESKSKFGPLVIVSAAQDLLTTVVPELTQAGFEVTVCADAKKALNLTDAKPARWQPNMIIVDVVMPQMSGFELVRRLADKYSGKKVPILLMSQYKSREDEIEASSAGAIGVLSKPLTAQALQQVFEKAEKKDNI